MILKMPSYLGETNKEKVIDMYLIKVEWWDECLNDLTEAGDIYIFDKLEEAVQFGYRLCFDEEIWHSAGCPTDAYLYELKYRNGCAHLSGANDKFLCSWTQLKYKVRD